MMFRSLLAVAAAVSVVYADSSSSSAGSGLADVPACATSCLVTAIQASGCALTDYHCICVEQEAAVTKASMPCLLKSTCTTTDVTSKSSSLRFTFFDSILNLIVELQQVSANICQKAAADDYATSSATGGSTSTAMSSSASGSSSSTFAGTQTMSTMTMSRNSTTSAIPGATGVANVLQAGQAVLGLSFLAALAL